MLQSSLEWNSLRDELFLDAWNVVEHSKYMEVHKLLTNLDAHISDISKLEVSARQTKNRRKLNLMLEKFNEELEFVKGIICLCALQQFSNK